MSEAIAPMVIVAGHVMVEPADREAYLVQCATVVEMARRAEGCLDFVLSADLLDPARVNVLERWRSQAAVGAFRGDGSGGQGGPAILAASVAEYDVAAVRILSGDGDG